MNRQRRAPRAPGSLDRPNDASELDVVVLFSDGAHTEGALTSADECFNLRVDGDWTTAGTEIPLKAWELSSKLDGTLRVVGPAKRDT